MFFCLCKLCITNDYDFALVTQDWAENHWISHVRVEIFLLVKISLFSLAYFAGYSKSWDVCSQLGQSESYGDLATRQELMAFALTHCPPSSIEPLLAASSSLQTEVSTPNKVNPELYEVHFVGCMDLRFVVFCLLIIGYFYERKIASLLKRIWSYWDIK